MKSSWLRPLALASLIANIGLVVTGAAVRLTGSGLGCPTWPECTTDSYTTTSEMGVHGVIEFTNRMLTFVLGILAVACVVAAIFDRPRRAAEIGRRLAATLSSPGRAVAALFRRATYRRAGTAIVSPTRRASTIRLSVAVLLCIPLQAVIGGITVLTDLNPWVVGLHFLASMVVIAFAYALWKRTAEPEGEPVLLVPVPVRHLARLTVLASAAVIAVGVVVTGSGPHAGDASAKRNGLDPQSIAQAHADVVMVLLGLTVALCFTLRAVNAPAVTFRAAVTLLAVELAQALIGFVQYFTHLPVLLVGAHLLGASLVWTATLSMLWSTRERPGVVPSVEPEPARSRAALPVPTTP
nr:COX15/CtaA family protein [Actinoplanes sp. TBRC 11911]